MNAGRDWAALSYPPAECLTSATEYRLMPQTISYQFNIKDLRQFKYVSYSDLNEWQ